MKGTLAQRSFSKGEIDPDLFGRTDLAQYQAALKKARNVIFNKRGILQNAPGTEIIIPAKDPTIKTRQIPFKFSFNQQFDLVFGDGYIHIIENGVPVFNFSSAPKISIFPNINNPTITILGGSSSTIPVTSSQIANGMLVQVQPFGVVSFLKNQPILSSDMSLFCFNRWFLINNIVIGTTTTTFNLTDLLGNPIDSTTWGIYGNNLQLQTIYEIATPYSAQDLPLVKFAQSFDIVQLRHHLYPRFQLERLASNSWLFTRNTGWPSQIQVGNTMSASGGLAGNVDYYYKVTSFNKDTRQESLPCPVAAISNSVQEDVISATATHVAIPSFTVVNVAIADSSGFSTGDVVYFSSNLSDGINNYLVAGVPYSLLNVSVGNISIIVSGSLASATLSFDSGTFVYKVSVSAANEIVSISTDNPVVVQTDDPHGLIDGQEVTIQGTGIFGLDGLTFNVTIQSDTEVSLNGVNGANYDMSGFVPSSSTIISPTAIIVSGHTPTEADPITIVGAVLNPATFQSNVVFAIYASTQLNSGYGFIGYAIPAKITGTFSFVDQGVPPDTTLSPKSYTPLFLGSGNNPSTCNYYQQRLVEFATDNNPQGLFASVVGDYNDFTTHDPIQSNDAIIMDAASNELNQIFDSADSGFLILMTDVGPLIAAGDTTGEFTPSSNLIKRQMFAGASQIPRPLTIFKNVVYLEANQSSMRDLEILVTPYYTYISKSDDVSIFSEHLFSESIVTAWDYKLYPDSQIQSVREDGKMIQTTYLKEQDVTSFSLLDTLGKYEDIVCIQEGTETASYVGTSRDSGRWIERFASRNYSDPTIDAIFTHATESYNGLVNDGSTAVLSGQTTFGGNVVATFDTNLPDSIPSDDWQMNFKVNSGLVDANGDEVIYYARMICGKTTDTTIEGTLLEAIDPLMLGMTISDIRVASKVVGGLWHLEGQQVSVVGDGMVIANPNDSGCPVVTVTNGWIELKNAFGVIHVGLPYISDVQTLDLDQHQGETFMDKKIAVKRVILKLLETGTILSGPDFTEKLPKGVQMFQPKLRELEGYDSATNLFTGIVPISMDARYGYGGSFALRNLQPLPLTILSIDPFVEVQTA